jgi:hypothetical protein
MLVAGGCKLRGSGGICTVQNAALSVEVIDLKFPSTTCRTHPDLPTTAVDSMGGLGFQNSPLICGGVIYVGYYNISNKCYSFDGTLWTQSARMNKARFLGAMSFFPSQNSSRRLMVTGGTNDLQSAEVLTAQGWEMFSIPGSFGQHCQVVVNSTTLLVIVGLNAKATFYVNTQTNVWVPGPTLRVYRSRHSCGMIKKDINSQEMSIIVAGGSDWRGFLSSVEILDPGSNTWRSGPVLPMAREFAQMVEDHDGGVVVVGGNAQTFPGTDALLQLPHAGPGAVWTLMKQKLKVARTEHVAFMVPDSYC